MQENYLHYYRNRIRTARIQDEKVILDVLISNHGLADSERDIANQFSLELISNIRENSRPGLMEVFLAEYGLSTDEGVALMCLAEALLRVPDTRTIDELIEDKIVPSNWGEHNGKSSSQLVNATTWGLMFTGKLLNKTAEATVTKTLKATVKRLGEPVIRAAVKRAMKEMGYQFVLGQSIEDAVKRGEASLKQGYNYSYDMLGEAAITYDEADKYFDSYKDAILTLSKTATHKDTKKNPGISIKLSALHPRYESTHSESVAKELVPRVLELAQLSKAGNIGLNIDAEESERLDISLDVIETVLADNSLENWDGFGVVVQAYNKSASYVLDWLNCLAETFDRKIMVRLVKGAYWDSEIKHAQVEGSLYFPVFTTKSATDVSYLCCAKKLISMSDRIYPQFATHNANTISAIVAIAPKDVQYEFQRLHGMGTSVYDTLRKENPVPCRIYAPVGVHQDLLAYLVRRLLENGANSSFVNQLVNEEIPVKEVANDPFVTLTQNTNVPIANGAELFGSERKNSKGWDLFYHTDKTAFLEARNKFTNKIWHATSLTVKPYTQAESNPIISPVDSASLVGEAVDASLDDVSSALISALPWVNTSASERASVLCRIADLLEANAGEIFAILSREAGKNGFDAVAELREAVDFLRFYANQIESLNITKPQGVFVCISPWNFPLAIFLGQIAAALAAGNAVLAKPAETTPIIAHFAVNLCHQAGVPVSALQLLLGTGKVVGSVLVSSPRVNGVCFTGSTNTAVQINRSMAKHALPNAPLIAETGGMNAMVVDSTALPQQAVNDIVRSAFQSAGQRCSALRVLYLQDDIYDKFLTMLAGAIDTLQIGDPWELSTDVGPLISSEAQQQIAAYVELAGKENRVIKQYSGALPSKGHYLAPTVIKIDSILDVEKEIFGPVLHIVKYPSGGLQKVINEINASRYGLTFGIHTRIDGRVGKLINSINAGNIYVNRDQIGAIVGSQPFGGEGLSGTGPKAGGPNYIYKFIANTPIQTTKYSQSNPVDLNIVQTYLDMYCHSRPRLTEHVLPGPTGESNILSEYGKGLVLCLGPTVEEAEKQEEIAKANGCAALIICPGAAQYGQINGFLDRALLKKLSGFSVVALWSDIDDVRQARQALAARDGEILPLSTGKNLKQFCRLERHVCVDTTSAGGNTALLAAQS